MYKKACKVVDSFAYKNYCFFFMSFVAVCVIGS